MQILWAFRFNPWRAPSGSAKLLRNFASVIYTKRSRGPGVFHASWFKFFFFIRLMARF
jgi:hypothetical protein